MRLIFLAMQFGVRDESFIYTYSPYCTDM